MAQHAICLVWLTYAVLANAVLDLTFNPHVVRVDRSNFNDISEKHDLTAIYFYVKATDHLSQFLGAINDTVATLIPYGIAIGINDCTNESAAFTKFCSSDDAGESIYIFRDGAFLINFGIRALFNELSIISNMLQLRLLREVQIVHSASERNHVEQDAIGKHVLIHGCFRAVGTQEHAIFMQVAYAYKDNSNVKFVFGTSLNGMEQIYQQVGLTKEMLVLDEDLNSMVFVSNYKKAITKATGVSDNATSMSAAVSSFPSHAYVGPMNYDSFRTFVDALDMQDVVELGKNSPPQTAESLAAYLGGRHVLVAIYNASNHEDVQEVVQKIGTMYYKIFITFLSDVESSQHLSSLGCQLIAERIEPPVYCLLFKNKPTPLIIQEANTNAAVQRLKSTISVQLSLEGTLPEKAISSNGVRRATKDVAEAELDADLELILAVETQDDEVAMYVEKNKHSKEHQLKVPALTRATFSNFVAEDGGCLVLFHLKQFDHRSAFAMDALSAALDILKQEGFSTPLAAINCFDWPDVCAEANVFEYPTLRTYRHGGKPSLGSVISLSVDSFVTAGKLASIELPYKVKTVDLLSLVSDLLHADSTNSSVVLGLFDIVDSPEYLAFTEACSHHDGKAVFFVAFDTVAEQLIKRHGEARHSTLPAVLAFQVRGGILDQAAQIYSGNASSASALKDFVAAAALPSFVELTPVLLPALRNKGLPVALLFTSDMTSAAMNSLNEASRSHLSLKFTFAYLLSHTATAQTILATYWHEHTLTPALAVVDFIKGEVYRYEDAEQFDVPSVEAWLDSVALGNVAAAVQLPPKQWLPAHPGYDFLAMADSGPSQFDHDRLTKPSHQKVDSHDSGDLVNTSAPVAEILSTSQDAALPVKAVPIGHSEL